VGQVTSLDPRGVPDQSVPSILNVGDATFKARDGEEITLYIRMKGFEIGQVAVTRYNRSARGFAFVSDQSSYVLSSPIQHITMQSLFGHLLLLLLLLLSLMVLIESKEDFNMMENTSM
jgi:hypothetical protein